MFQIGKIEGQKKHISENFHIVHTLACSIRSIGIPRLGNKKIMKTIVIVQYVIICEAGYNSRLLKNVAYPYAMYRSKYQETNACISVNCMLKSNYNPYNTCFFFCSNPYNTYTSTCRPTRTYQLIVGTMFFTI